MKSIFTLLFASIFSFALQAQPTDNAGNPPSREAADVISIYGDTYSTISNVNYDPNWGQPGFTLVNPAYDPGTGDVILAYPNFTYQGTEFIDNSQDASLMEYLHVDIWVAAGTDRLVKITPIDNSGEGPSEVLVEVPLNPGAWSSVDLPKSVFGGMSWNNVIQMKFDGQFNGDGSANTTPFDIYVDNIYFWKEPVTSGTDATLADLQVDGTTIPGFGSGIYSYNYGLPGGTTDIPMITAATPTDQAASTVITQASSLPGTATVAVTSGNGLIESVYSVNFYFDSPADAAPDPSEQEINVISLFSDLYTDVTVDTWHTDWSNSAIEDVEIAGNPTKKYTALGFNGIETVSVPVDASEMVFFNMDIWSPNMTEFKIKLVDFLGDGYGGANGDTEAELTFPVTQGEWMTLEIPLSDFESAGMTSFSDVNQYIISSVPYGQGILYVDNVYFSKLGSATHDLDTKTAFSMFPNPVQVGQWLHASENVVDLELLNLNGQLITSSYSGEMEMTGIQSGLYLIKATLKDGRQQVQKLVVK